MTADTSPFLLLLSPSVVQNPELAAQVLAEFNSAPVFHHQVLDRVSEQAIVLERSFYNRVHLATDGSKIALDENTLSLLFASMAPNASLSGVDVSSDPLPALMAGFVKKDDGSLHKPAPASTATVSLKRPSASSTTTTTRSVPLPFKRLEKAAAKLNINDDDEDDDDLIDENELVDGDLTPAIQIPERCQPTNGKKRRKACKDCTCGLKELEQQELEAQQAKQNNVVQLAVDDTAEIDFTVPGKTTGSCGSCALGDAFRCDGCPYLGLPPFKPGQVVSIDALGGDDF